MNKVGLLIIATGKYDVFIEQLLRSVEKYFFVGEKVDIYLFVDKVYNAEHSERLNIVQILIKHYPFPYATLYRYKHFSTHSHILKSDYLFYIDADMRIVATIGEEIIPSLSGLTATIHPGFYRGGGSWEENKSSMAFMAKEQQNKYYAGGFQGGESKTYLKACYEMAKWIDIDEKNGVIPIWHDESMWNKYLSASGSVKLSPSYCYPESWKLPFPKKILALDKDHAKMRS